MSGSDGARERGIEQVDGGEGFVQLQTGEEVRGEGVDSVAPVEGRLGIATVEDREDDSTDGEGGERQSIRHGPGGREMDDKHGLESVGVTVYLPTSNLTGNV